MKILTFGSCNFDHVYKVEHIVSPGETLAASSVETHPGGKGLNQTLALARAGAAVCFAGCIGSDGNALRQLLSDNGVDTGHMCTVDGLTGQAMIQVTDAGQNSIIIFAGANGQNTCAYMDSVLQHFSAGDFILLQNEISNMEYLLERAYEKGMRIFLNPSPIDDVMLRVDLNKIYCLILNEVEAAMLSGTEDMEEFMQKMKHDFPKLKVMLTLGGDGCVYFDSETTARHPVFDVPVVDTTACGDTFCGYFLAQVAAGASVQEAVQIASVASSIAVSIRGAAPSIPKNSEVQRLRPVFLENAAKQK